MSTVLLTAVGSYAAGPAMDSLKQQGHRVVACDIYPRAWNSAAMEADAFFQAVLCTDKEAYIAQLEEAVQRENIDFLIPLTDPEVDVLCAEKARFAALGCTVCTPDEPCVRLCRNKLDVAQSLEAACICQTIPTASPYGRTPLDSEFPIMLKPLSGRSSQGQVVARDLAAYEAALKTRSDLIAQPFIKGDVFTVDVARDLYGGVRCLARQEVLRTVNGLGATVRVLPGHPLERICADVAAHIGLVGVVNMEFIAAGDGFCFLEVNPRFSGGVGFSIASGMDFAWYELLCHQGEELPKAPAIAPMVLTRKTTPIITEK